MRLKINDQIGAVGNVATGQKPTDINQPDDIVGRRLREMFDAIENQAIPDRFLDLLQKLDEAERALDAGGDIPDRVLSEKNDH